MGRDALEVSELIENAHLGDQVGVEQATESTHRQTTVFDLGELVAGHGGRVLAEAEWVEAEVSRGAITVDRFQKRDCSENLQEADPQQKLGHRTKLHEEVVRLGCGHRVDTRKAPELRQHVADNTKHSNTA